MECGTYTIVGPKGGHRTLEIVPHWIAAEAEKGVKVARFLRGPDNSTDFTGFAFINPGRSGTHGASEAGTERVSVWRKFREGYEDIKAALRFLLAHQDRLGEFGLAYALKSGRCYRCQKKLTVPVSVHNGLGPTCADKLGVVRIDPQVAAMLALAKEGAVEKIVASV